MVSAKAGSRVCGCHLVVAVRGELAAAISGRSPGTVRCPPATGRFRTPWQQAPPAAGARGWLAEAGRFGSQAGARSGGGRLVCWRSRILDVVVCRWVCR